MLGRQAGTKGEQVTSAFLQGKAIPGGRGSYVKGTGMLVGKLEFKPYRRPIRVWLRLYLTPKGDQAKTDNQIRAMVI